MMVTSKKGISALQVQRTMGFGSYETAHSMCHKIRAAMVEPETKLGGIVEIDETWVGGLDGNRHWDKKTHVSGGAGSGKIPVIGAAQRKGNVIARVLDHVSRDSAEWFVQEMISDKVSLIATDEAGVYRGLRKTGLPHGSVNHRQGKYVVGAMSENSGTAPLPSMSEAVKILYKGAIDNIIFLKRQQWVITNYALVIVCRCNYNLSRRKRPRKMGAFAACISGMALRKLVRNSHAKNDD